MQVFRLYFKLLKSVAPALIIYIIAFIGLTIINSTKQDESITNYEQTKINVAIVNYNEDNLLVKDFVDYLGEYCNIYNYGEDETVLTDALFFHKVAYIITIPYHFGEDFISGKMVSIEKKAVPDDLYTLSVDNAINKYLNTARVYIKSIPILSQDKLISYVRNDINTGTKVMIDLDETNTNNYLFYNNYFNTASYIILACCILGIGMIMLTFQNVNIQHRNMVTSLPMRSINLQLISGNLIFVLVFDILLIILSVLLNKDKRFSLNEVLFWINLLIFSISALSISFLTALLGKNKGINSAISIVVSLGFSFISGAFVPQSLLGDSVLRLASFTPVYWFIKGNNTIANALRFNWNTIFIILSCMAIQLGFAIAILSISLVIGKRKRQGIV